MNIISVKRPAVLAAAALAALVTTGAVLADGGSRTAAERGEMIHQMEQLKRAGNAMRDASPDQRPQAMQAHRTQMMRMMRSGRERESGTDGGPKGSMEAMGGMGGMAGTGQKAGDMAPAQMHAMQVRMDMMETMMGEMVDYIEMHERSEIHR